MTYNLDLINRAMMRAGQETITEEDIKDETTKWRTIKAFYLSTILAVISSADWTSLKKRKVLEEDEDSDNLSGYNYKYILPVDCAKAIEIDDNGVYIIEGNYLYTNTASAKLLYVSNGKRAEFENMPDEYASKYIYYSGTRWTWDEELSTYIEDEEQEDIPLYDELNLSPELMQCLEYHLAAEIVLKITGNASLFGNLIQLATAIEDDARKTSKAKGVSKSNGSTWWSERLGLPTEDNDYVNN